MPTGHRSLDRDRQQAHDLSPRNVDSAGSMIAHAAFRPMRDEIALAMNGSSSLYLPSEYADQENDWSSLSWVFHSLLNQPPGTVDQNPRTGWGRIQPWDGRPQRIILDTAVAYAQYVLATSLGR